MIAMNELFLHEHQKKFFFPPTVAKLLSARVVAPSFMASMVVRVVGFEVIRITARNGLTVCNSPTERGTPETLKPIQGTKIRAGGLSMGASPTGLSDSGTPFGILPVGDTPNR